MDVEQPIYKLSCGEAPMLPWETIFRWEGAEPRRADRRLRSSGWRERVGRVKRPREAGPQVLYDERWLHNEINLVRAATARTNSESTVPPRGHPPREFRRATCSMLAVMVLLSCTVCDDSAAAAPASPSASALAIALPASLTSDR